MFISSIQQKTFLYSSRIDGQISFHISATLDVKPGILSSQAYFYGVIRRELELRNHLRIFSFW
jgi:hypothetical protein